MKLYPRPGRRPRLGADLIFVGGAIGVGSARRPHGTAVAVRNERIIAVGPQEDVLELRDFATEVVDLRGRMLLPGFQDAHVHPVFAGLDLLQCDLRSASSVETYLETISRYATEHPNEPWILGGGWSMDVFPGGRPHAALLDAIVPDRPVYLTNREWHGAWVNSAAMALAGIDRHTRDPRHGRLERDHAGVPTGLLHESAGDLLSHLLPQHDATAYASALDLAQRHLHSLGITAWQDAIVGDYLTRRSPLQTYVDAADREQLTARVVGALWWDRERGLDQVRELLRQRKDAQREHFRPRMVKMMLDGIVETRTASMLESYCGEHAPSPSSFFDPEQLALYVSELDRHGFSIHFHAVGDRAVREALDAVEAARSSNGVNGNRHQIAHLDVVHPDDIARFGQLGVIANIQPLWACHEPQTDEIKLPLLGPVRSTWSFPFEAIRAGGARLAAGSDWGVTSADPLAAIHVAVNRIRPDLAEEPFLPAQRLALADAVAAYTSGSAHANGLDETGRIDTGQLADLVVLDHDLGAVLPGELAQVRVEQTYVGGQRVYSA